MKLSSFHLALAATDARTAAIALASTAADLIQERREKRKRVLRRVGNELKVIARARLSVYGAYDAEDFQFVCEQAGEEFIARLDHWLAAERDHA